MGIKFIKDLPLLSDKYDYKMVDRKQTKWKRNEALAETVDTLFTSLKKDITSSNKRYEYVEALLRNFPGKVGMNLRYNILKNYFGETGDNVIIWPGVRIRNPNKLYIGNNVQVGIENMFQASAGITIGDNTLLGPGVKIWTINHSFTEKEQPIRDQGYDTSPVYIGNDCWISSNAFIKPGTILPDGCIVAAGSVVGAKKYPAYSIIQGNPAKSIGERTQLKYFNIARTKE